MAASCVPPFIGLLALSLLPNTDAYKWTKWGMYLITVPYVLALFLAWTLSKYRTNYHLCRQSLIHSVKVPSNVAGRTNKTIISSATFLGYCVGNMCGSQIFKERDAPRYIPGTVGACACLGLEFILICSWRGYYVWQNWRRDKKAAAGGLSDEEREQMGRDLAEENWTDLQNEHFRYTL